MVTTSSLVQKPSGVPVNSALTCVIVRCAFTRPGTPPICGPFSSSGNDRENRLPVRTHAAPRRTAASSTRLSVPSSSASPHRPQLETCAARSVNAGDSNELLRRGFAVLGRRVHRVLVELRQHFLAEQLHRVHD